MVALPNFMIRILLFALGIICSSCLAAGAPASEASIREMLAVTEVRKLLDNVLPQYDAMMKNAMNQALGGKQLDATGKKIADKMAAKISKLMQEEMNWEKLEPIYLSIYTKSFTQEEVDGMLKFYKSPAGQAVIKKMPVVMQLSMQAMQQTLIPVMQKMQTIVQETVAEIEAEGAAK